jgi:phospholipase/carboxylesterase
VNSWPQTEIGIAQSLQRVEQSIENACARFHIAPHRIFLVGLENGGSMALRLGMTAPRRFAGVASIGGPFPESLHPMSNLLQARKLPVLIAHGRDSDEYSMDRVCEELKLFHVAGMSLNLRQYPCGQELTTQMLSDLNVWMMQLVTGVDSTRTSSSASSFSLDELN